MSFETDYPELSVLNVVRHETGLIYCILFIFSIAEMVMAA